MTQSSYTVHFNRKGIRNFLRHVKQWNAFSHNTGNVFDLPNLNPESTKTTRPSCWPAVIASEYHVRVLSQVYALDIANSVKSPKENISLQLASWSRKIFKTFYAITLECALTGWSSMPKMYIKRFLNYFGTCECNLGSWWPQQSISLRQFNHWTAVER